MTVVNVHSRRLPVSAEKVGELVETFGTPGDRIWPGPPFPTLHMDGPLAAGVSGGHGGKRYTVIGYQPNRWVRFEFEPGDLTGFHEFTIRPLDDDLTELRHTMVLTLSGTARVLWPAVIRWLHDDCLESLLDRAERELTGSVRTPHRGDRYARLLLNARGLLGPLGFRL